MCCTETVLKTLRQIGFVLVISLLRLSVSATATTEIQHTEGNVPGDRIVGGLAAAVNSAPFFSALVTIDSHGELGYDQLCGGALIGEEWVITASHCIIDRETGKLRSNLFGFDVGFYCGRDKGEGYNCGQEGRGIREAKDWFVPKDFSPDLFYLNDVACVQLKEPVRGVPYAVPDNGALYRELVPFTHFLRTFGIGIDQTGRFSQMLRYADLMLVSNDWCEAEWQRPGVFQDRVLCLSIHQGALTCTGDSGGPVILPGATSLDGRDVIIGVVTGGETVPCSQRTLPTIYGRVGAFYNFLRGVVCSRSSSGSMPSWCPGGDASNPAAAAAVFSDDPPTELAGTLRDAGDCKDVGKFRPQVYLKTKKKCSWLEKDNRIEIYCQSRSSNAASKCAKTCGCP